MSCSLLIVEDDLGQLEMVSAKFVRAGYSVVSVHHPRQALEAASFRQFQVALLEATVQHAFERVADEIPGMQIVPAHDWPMPCRTIVATTAGRKG